MTVYMVERDLPGITLEQLGGAQKSAIETSEKWASRCAIYGAPISPVSPA